MNTQDGTARHGTARHGTARHGTARHGTARHGTETAQQRREHRNRQDGAGQHSAAEERVGQDRVQQDTEGHGIAGDSRGEGRAEQRKTGKDRTRQGRTGQRGETFGCSNDGDSTGRTLPDRPNISNCVQPGAMYSTLWSYGWYEWKTFDTSLVRRFTLKMRELRQMLARTLAFIGGGGGG